MGYSTAQVILLIRASNIISAIRAETCQVRVVILEFGLEDVGTYSLLYGRAMVMHITGVPDRTLMDIGRWRLLGFMIYIQHQMSSFSPGVLVRMSKQPWFRHL